MATILRFPAGDCHLVARVRAGDADAFAALVSRFSPRLLAQARRILGGSHHDAEDIVQEALIRAHAALQRDERAIALNAWLYAIVRNLALDHIARRRRRADIVRAAAVVHDERFDPALAAERREELEAIVTTLRELPERQREALSLREFGGASNREIGSRFGISEKATKALVHRARHALQQQRAAAA